jgi:tight adherence protein B
MPPPISVEFRRVLREAELGLSFPDSLAGLVQRTPSADLVIFTSAVAIQQRVGGDLAQIFRVISHTIRERLRIRGETRVLTAQARYSAYIVGALPVFLFVFLWVTNYQYLSGLFQPGLPRMLLLAGLAGIALGFYSMQKIAAIEV